jgi:uncharacterized protein YbjT (DUF2867 family)
MPHDLPDSPESSRKVGPIVYSGKPLFLVTGATGTIGRPLTELLLAEGAAVRAVTRDPRTARLPENAEVVRGGDRSSPDALADALVGVTAMFLNPAVVGDSAGKLLELARERGVERVVLLSSGTVQDRVAEQPDVLAVWHKQIEDAVTGSGLEWTILRATEFASNVISQWGQQIRGGVVRGAYGGSTTAPVHERDIAAVAARALLSTRHGGATYLLTGPQSLTRVEMAGVLAAVLGCPLRFEEVARAQALLAMTGHGLPQPVAQTLLGLQERSVGRAAFVSSAVEQVTGRPALTFARWVADHAAAFA